MLIVSDSPDRLIPTSLSNSSSLQRSIYLIQPLRKNGVERLVRTPFNRYMSLRLGLASISSSATRIASKVFGTAIASDQEEKENDGSSNSDNEGSKDGDVPDDGVSSVAGLSLRVATTAADVSVGAKDGPDPQEGGDLEKQGQLQRKKNEKKNNLGSLVWFYLLVVVSILVVDGSKQSSSRCGSDQSGIDVTYAADNCDLACNLNSDVVIDKGSDSVKVKIVEMQDLHLDGNASSPESSKVAKAQYRR